VGSYFALGDNCDSAGTLAWSDLDLDFEVLLESFRREGFIFLEGSVDYRGVVGSIGLFSFRGDSIRTCGDGCPSAEVGRSFF
jgi:hypothetical protein